MATNFKHYYKDKVEIDGQLYEVTPEVAALMNRSDWNESYQERKRKAPVKRKDAEGEKIEFDPLASSRECSLNALMETGAGRCLRAETESFEDEVVDRMITDMRMEILLGTLPSLSVEEKRMLTTITDDISSREYERMYGIPRRTMLDRRARLLKDLRRRIEAVERSRRASRHGYPKCSDVRLLFREDDPVR